MLYRVYTMDQFSLHSFNIILACAYSRRLLYGRIFNFTVHFFYFFFIHGHLMISYLSKFTQDYYLVELIVTDMGKGISLSVPISQLLCFYCAYYCCIWTP
jgi:hypothetical protein